MKLGVKINKVFPLTYMKLGLKINRHFPLTYIMKLSVKIKAPFPLTYMNLDVIEINNALSLDIYYETRCKNQ